MGLVRVGIGERSVRPPRTWEGLGCGKGLWIKSLGLGVVLLAAESLTSSAWCSLCLMVEVRWVWGYGPAGGQARRWEGVGKSKGPREHYPGREAFHW